MKLALRILEIVIIATFCSITAFAQIGLDKVAQSTMNFQLVSVSPRASALGEAVYAISTGADAIFTNPAGLSEMKNTRDVTLSYTAWIADIKYTAGAFAWDLGDAGTVGVSALGVDYGTIYATRLVGSNEGSANYNTPYEDLGEMQNVGAYSFGISYGRHVNDQFLVGGTMRYTGQNLGQSLLLSGVKNNNAAKLVFDIGVKYYTALPGFRFGMTFRNFSTSVLREKISEQMPLTFTLATAIDLFDTFDPGHPKETSLLVGVDYLHPNNYSERMNFGVEYTFMGMLALRGGYQTNRDLASWSAGIGLFKKVSDYDIRVDYSYSAEEYFTNVSRVSIGLGF